MTATTFLHDLTARGVHVWPEGSKLKLDAPIGILTDDDRQALREHKAALLAALSESRSQKSAHELVAEALARHKCPDCYCPLNLQDRTLDSWYCPSCRLWFGGKESVVPLRPITAEQMEAKQLLADLQAAGCGIRWDGDELRITNITKISTALWMRLENVESGFLKAAREMAESGSEVDVWSDCS